MSIKEEIENLKNEYSNENPELFKKLEKIVNAHSQWDKGINGADNLTTVLLYEYVKALHINEEMIEDKINNRLVSIRYGHFKSPEDDNIYSEGNSVTSQNYIEENATCGAHTVNNISNGNMESAIVLFDNIVHNDGIKDHYTDLTNLQDIRSTFFHELTHVMECSRQKISDLTDEERKELIIQNNDSLYVNFLIDLGTENKTFSEYEQILQEYLKNNEYIYFSGISTIEINKNCTKRIMHNKISEGATEAIARIVLDSVNEKPYDPDRYILPVKAANCIFDTFKEKDFDPVQTYLTDSFKLIRKLEEQKEGKKDLLHYMSEYVDFKDYTKARIGRDTNLSNTNVKNDLGFVEPETDIELKKLLNYIITNNISLSNEGNELIKKVFTFSQKISNAKKAGGSKDDIDNKFLNDFNSKYKAKLNFNAR